MRNPACRPMERHFQQIAVENFIQRMFLQNFTAMKKKVYHICLSAGEEAYCRSEEDYTYCFNCLALAVAATVSDLMAESIMSTHFHECVRSTRPKDLLHIQRYAYSRYFNEKYSRKGRLGEKYPFITEIDGLYHILAALSYVLRNALHHGLSATPFGYRHSSARSFFSKDLGFEQEYVLLPESKQYPYLPAHVRCPSGYKMDESGLILRETVIDVPDVEHLFMTPRSYLYYMNRLSGEEWAKEQEKDNLNIPPVSLDTMEPGSSSGQLRQMLTYERGRSDYKTMTDIQLCEMIDNELLPISGADSVYCLPREKKIEIANMLHSRHRLPEAQIKRCLVL